VNTAGSLYVSMECWLGNHLDAVQVVNTNNYEVIQNKVNILLFFGFEYWGTFFPVGESRGSFLSGFMVAYEAQVSWRI